MKNDKPILFSAQMVRALLEGRKTQTRRMVKGRHVLDHRFHIGNRLWVREGWRDEHPRAIQDGRYSQPGRAGIPGPPKVSYQTIYRADGPPLQVWRRQAWPYFDLGEPEDDVAARHPEINSNFDRAGKDVYWGTPIHMPRWASRLTLRVTAHRVERVQDISEADAQAEGAVKMVLDDEGKFFEREQGTYRCGFAGLWSHINGAESWDSNPWVVALTFSVIKSNIDAIEAAA